MGASARALTFISALVLMHPSLYGRGTIRAYTDAFIEQRPRRPRLFLPEP